MKILVTGFDPFGGESVNPSLEVIKKLPDDIKGTQIIKLKIPTVIKKSLDMIRTVVESEKPDIILSLGQAGGRPDITVERIGININDCSIPDNEGNQPIDEMIFPEGPNAYFVSLPIKSIVNKLRKHGIPASISNSAGTFICNHVCYGTSHLVATKYPMIKSGFIHIPFLPEQTVDKKGMPSMSLEMIVDGIILAIETMIENNPDIKESGGSIC